MPKSASLRSALNDLAEQFASGVLRAIRSANLEDLLAEGAGAARRGPGRPRGGGSTTASPRAKRKSGRLARLSPEQIAEVVAKVVSAIRGSKGKGLRAEQIRKQLGLDVREMPRVLREGVAKKMLKSKGQKRATTY